MGSVVALAAEVDVAERTMSLLATGRMGMARRSTVERMVERLEQEVASAANAAEGVAEVGAGNIAGNDAGSNEDVVGDAQRCRGIKQNT